MLRKITLRAATLSFLARSRHGCGCVMFFVVLGIFEMFDYVRAFLISILGSFLSVNTKTGNNVKTKTHAKESDLSFQRHEFCDVNFCCCCCCLRVFVFSIVRTRITFSKTSENDDEAICSLLVCLGGKLCKVRENVTTPNSVVRKNTTLRNPGARKILTEPAGRARKLWNRHERSRRRCQSGTFEFFVSLFKYKRLFKWAFRWISHQLLGVKQSQFDRLNKRCVF